MKFNGSIAGVRDILWSFSCGFWHLESHQALIIHSSIGGVWRASHLPADFGILTNLANGHRYLY